jgi:hypothetical protein
MQLSTIFDKFECAFSDQNSLVASVITHLEKVEGKRVVNNIHNHNIPQVDSRGALHSTMSATPGASSEEPMYGMLAGFYQGQSPLPKPTPVKPPQVGSTALSGQMVMVPEQLLPLSVVPSTLVQSQNNAYGTAQQCIAQ